MSEIDVLAKEFLSLKNIAVAGVTRKPGSTANIIYKRLKETGHNVYPVNPNTNTFEGVKCYPAIKSVTENIDGVVIVTKPSVTEKIVKECVEKGVRRIWMHNMFGFKGSNKSGTSISEKATPDVPRE